MLRIKWVALVAIIWPATGHAALDWSPDPTWSFSDIASLLPEGRIESGSAFAYQSFGGDWHGGVGANEHYSAASSVYTQELSYGITDRLEVGISGDYSRMRTQYTFTEGQPGFQSSSHRFGNPVIGATYRIIDQKAGPVSIDGTVEYSPSLWSNDSEAGFEFGEIAVSRRMKSITVQGFADAEYIDDNMYNDFFSTTTIHSSPYWAYRLGAQSQMRFLSSWAVNSGFAATFIPYRSYGVRYNPTGTQAAYTDLPDPSVETYVALQYTIVPDRAVLGIQYQHNFVGDDHLSGYSGIGAVSGTWTNQAENVFSVSARLLF
jgi:hypothetical protein